MPLDTQDSNAAASQAATPLPDSAASSKSGQTEPEDQSAGRQLETARMAVPVTPQESNAAASQAPAVQSGPERPDVQGSGMQSTVALAASQAVRENLLRHAMLHFNCCVT